ncbi:hypothetical protein JKP88DRAFT_270306 [Tribonema minus]|uniref:Uncharacterized protein n=1 Tax=Tribonema minus TaxID=303371 RepID=A0A835YQ91_9STRA|nr:hypothetical protein JKP88DRAFT_270306 [Tribonema minus]
MSLVDTGVVGQRSSLDLAALGPATNLCDSLLYGCAFLSIATTNLLASALANGDKRESQKVVSQALAIGLTFGTALSIAVFLFGTRMMLWSAGGNAAIAPIALKYSNIRMIGAPACLASMIAQAACLGSKDSVTPLFVVLACGAFNAVGDVFLVRTMGMGIRGAAIATSVSEVIGMGLLMRAVARMQGPRVYPFIAMPGRQDFWKFMTFAGPIFVTLLCKILFYSGMTVLVTGGGDTVMLAAHTCMLRIFFFFTTFGDSLSQAAQAFLPGMMASDRAAAAAHRKRVRAQADADTRGANLNFNGDAPSAQRRAPAQAPVSAGNLMIRKLLTLAAGIGVCMALSAGLVPLRLPHLFTNDALITDQMRRLVPVLSWSLLVHASVMGLEGILLAKRELSFLAKTYLVNAIMAVLRLAQFGSRLMVLKRQERASAAAIA